MDIFEMIKAGGQCKFEVTGEDLLNFGRKLVEEAQSAKAQELAMQQEANDKETWVSAKEVEKMCNVCSTTLWHWERKGYLIPAHVGRQKRYALSEIKAILTNNKQSKPLG
jgi:hypothetical protein